MTHSLKEAVRKQVEHVHLNDGQLDALNALQSETRPRPTPIGQTRRWSLLAGMAAVIALTLGLLLYSVTDTSESGTLVAEIAAEVVHNHLNRKPLEVNTDQLDSIRNYFTRLDFVPVESAYLKSRGLTLLGGRYCSLQGVTAAQLRFSSVAENDTHTLYEVGYDPKIFKALPDYDKGETPVTAYSNGVKVTLWVEKGVLFALTGD